VPLLIVVSLITALILNREHQGGAASGAPCFSSRCFCRRWSTGLIWKWILQRQGLLNLGAVRVRLRSRQNG
jgi:alpha-1,4-digalacturonate transport system permease protein